jgi:hypothetical protein
MDTPAPVDSSRALVPAREQTVLFYDDPIPVAQAPDGDLYVAVGALTMFLGLTGRGGRGRINRDPVLAAGARMVTMTTPDGKRRATLCLPLHLIPGWLFGIDTGRVKPELAAKLNLYRAECFKVLWAAFSTDTPAPPAPSPAPSSGATGAALAVEIATAVLSLAQQQLDLETRLADVAGRQEVMADFLRGFIQKTEGRLTTLETQASAGAPITEAQAADIALAVKNVGQVLAGRGDRNGYAKVYSEMYRRWRITSYKSLPAVHFQAVLDWLAGWYADLQGAGGPSTP